MPRKRNANLGFGAAPPGTGNIGFVPEISVKTAINPSDHEVVKEITIGVNSIGNIDRNKVKEIAIRVEFKGELLGQSLPVPVGRGSADIEMSATLNALSTSPEFMDELLSNPILFTVLDCTRPVTSSSSVPNQTQGGEHPRKAAPHTPTSETPTCRTLGYCNLDLGQLVIGNENIKSTLLVEPELSDAPHEVRTWIKLPRLNVHATTDAPLMSEHASKFANTIGITVESIYNVPDYVAFGTVFETSIPIPAAGNKTNKIVFPNGVTMVKDSFPYKKKWLSLCYIENAGLRSRHRISQTYNDIHSSLPENVKIGAEIKASRRVIRWNTWKNCLMIKNDSNYFYNKLLKYGFWPVEIFYSAKSKEHLSKEKITKSERKSKQGLSGSYSHPEHFMAFLNLSPLLHPGVTKVRVAAQLLTYSFAEIVNKFGSDFVTDFGLTPSQLSLAGTKRKSGSLKSKSSLREPEESGDGLGVPVYDEHNSPTFIVVDIELLKPLIPKRSMESLEIDLKEILCLKEKMKKKTTSFDLMKERFSRTLLSMTSVLTDEYNNYNQNFPKDCGNTCDISVEFEKHLSMQENFCRIKATLENTIIELIREKYGVVSHYEEKIPEIYVYLVKEMHKVTNTCLEGQTAVSNTGFYTDNFQLYAEEAFEDGDYKLAKEYLLRKLSRNTSNPDYWLDYAVYFIKLSKFEDAVEAVKEALRLEFYHQIGLLMYALLMAKFLNSTMAETTAQVLLNRFPDFVEGWVALSLIYTVLNNTIGAQVAQQEARKLMCEIDEEKADKKFEEHDEFTLKVYKCEYGANAAKAVRYGVGSFVHGSSCMEPLSWTISFAPPENIFLKTAILLQKLGFYEYAALCLAEDLVSNSTGETPPPRYSYYLSVNHYLQGRYEEAIPILLKTVKHYGKDCFLWGLLGHCYYKLENHAQAIACYEYVKEAYNRPDDIHLIYTRLGYYYLQINKNACAKPLLLNACKYSPTPKAWKGVGIACLQLEELENAEIAFSEANYLDNKDPDIWAYLALTNAAARRLDLFRQCYIEAKKRKLENLDLIGKIKSFITLTGLADQDF